MNELQTVLDEIVAEAPVNRASWTDVRRRANRQRHYRAFVVAAALVATVAIAAPALGIGDRLFGRFEGTPVTSDRLSVEQLHVISAMASGTSPRVPSSQRQDLARFEASSLRQIAVRDGWAFFVADQRGGGLCVSSAPVDGPRLLGSIICTPDFPSEARPILDRSIFRGSINEPIVTALRGFAADGVASVAVVTESGALAAATPVHDNVYSRTDGLPDDVISGIVVLDATGHRLHSECYGPGPCSASSK